MRIGPLQTVVIGFDNQDISEQVAYELQAVRKQGLIRLIDFVFVEKNEVGELDANALSDLTREGAKRFLALVQGEDECLSTDEERNPYRKDHVDVDNSEIEELFISIEDIGSIVDRIPPGGAMMIALVEHLWASRLNELIENSGGALFAEKYIPRNGVHTWGPTLVEAVRTAAKSS